MKFKMQYPAIIFALLGLIIAITMGSFILDIMILAEVKHFVNTNPVLTVISLICSILMLALCISVLINSCYVMKDSYFNIVYGFFPVAIQFDKILVVLEDKAAKKLYIQYLLDNQSDVENCNFATINIKPSLYDNFIKVLLEKNNSIKHNIIPIEDINK